MRRIGLRLIHDGVQPGTPLMGPLQFGVQDTKGVVHAGRTHAGALCFDITLEVAEGSGAAPPILRGAFAHGPPAKRFLYLSWKRHGEHEHLWAWRIKIPLSTLEWHQIAQAEQVGHCLVADVRGRHPHTGEQVDWRIGTLHPPAAAASPAAI